MAQKPNVIIFGGINELAPLLALHLVPLTGEPLVSHLRIVDKPLMNPPTTYVIKEFPQLLKTKTDLVEYRQANLTVPATVSKCFSDPAPNSQPYTHIIDLTGEESYDRPAEIFITHTLQISLSIAQASTAHNVTSYVRYLPAFYDHIDKKVHKEEDNDGWKTNGARGVWWHETVRALGANADLPLVVVRGALPYGPGYVKGEIATAILLGLVYKHLGQEMKFLWSPKLRKHTIHSLDWVAAVWEASQFAASKDRKALDAALGVPLPPSGDKSVAGVQGAIGKDKGAVLVPVVNLVDDSDLSQESMAEVISKVYGIKTGFQGTIAEMLAKMKFEDVVEDVNELHMQEWAKIITESTPPVPSTPLSPYALQNQLEKHGCALDGEKFKSVLGYNLKHPHFNEETVKATIESWKFEGIWPITPQYS